MQRVDGGKIAVEAFLPNGGGRMHFRTGSLRVALEWAADYLRLPYPPMTATGCAGRCNGGWMRDDGSPTIKGDNGVAPIPL